MYWYDWKLDTIGAIKSQEKYWLASITQLSYFFLKTMQFVINSFFGMHFFVSTSTVLVRQSRHIYMHTFCSNQRIFIIGSVQMPLPIPIDVIFTLSKWDTWCKTTAFLILTHRGRVTHICVGKLTIIGSDNGLSPGRHQAIIRTNAGILLIGPLGTNFSEILITIETFLFKKMHLKILSAKWHPFCLGLNVLKIFGAI